jgi:hypothetical protein
MVPELGVYCTPMPMYEIFANLGVFLVLWQWHRGLITAAMILTIALLAIFARQFWLNIFHLFLFMPGSWLFTYSDTLIHLFPVKFWSDATLTIAVLRIMGGLSSAWMGCQWRRSFQKSLHIIKLFCSYKSVQSSNPVPILFNE